MEISRRDFLRSVSIGAVGIAGATAIGGLSGCTQADNTDSENTMDAGSDEVRMEPGIYCGEGQGFDWIEPVRVKIEVDETELKSIEVIEKGLNREEPLIMKAAEDLMIPRMLESQSTKVDTITGATMVSLGIQAATEDALKKALTAGGSSESALKSFQTKPTYSAEDKTMDYDVVICGLGGAGSAAAMATVEAMIATGRKVSVLALETAGKYGGTAANAGEPFSINAPRYLEKYNGGQPWCDYDSLYADWQKQYHDTTKGTPCKMDMVKLLMDESGKTIDWLQFDHGFLFTRGMKGFGTSTWLCKQQYVYKSNMLKDVDYATEYPDYQFGDRSSSVGQYYDSIIADYKALGGEYMLETEAYELIFDASGDKVTGVKARNHIDGSEYTINAKVVISCTGGFGGSGELQKKYLKNPNLPLLENEWRLWGMHQNTGLIIDSAITQGAGTYNIDMPPIIHFKTTQKCMTTFPTYYRDGLEERMQEQNCWSVNDVPMIFGLDSNSLQVGQDGVRHYNEAGTFAFWAGGPVWYTILGSDYIDGLAENGFPGEVGKYQNSTKVYGQGGFPQAQPVPEIYDALRSGIDMGYIYRAETLEELASQIGVPTDDFVAQVERYEGFCKAGKDDEFGKKADNLKSRINSGPYYAIRCNPVAYSDGAAFDVDENINVLKADGKTEIGGFYACGNDSGGVLYTNTLPYAQYGGVALGKAFTSGRLAGNHAVEYLQGK